MLPPNFSKKADFRHARQPDGLAPIQRYPYFSSMTKTIAAALAVAVLSACGSEQAAGHYDTAIIETHRSVGLKLANTFQPATFDVRYRMDCPNGATEFGVLAHDAFLTTFAVERVPDAIYAPIGSTIVLVVAVDGVERAPVVATVDAQETLLLAYVPDASGEVGQLLHRWTDVE
jgi:hypothetical protein